MNEIIFTKKVNLSKLCDELSQAGYPGIVFDNGTFVANIDLSEQDVQNINQIIQNHDPETFQTRNKTTLDRIAEMEALQTPRLYREALLESLSGNSTVNPSTGRTALQQFVWIEDQITSLRNSIT